MNVPTKSLMPVFDTAIWNMFSSVQPSIYLSIKYKYVINKLHKYRRVLKCVLLNIQMLLKNMVSST